MTQPAGQDPAQRPRPQLDPEAAEQFGFAATSQPEPAVEAVAPAPRLPSILVEVGVSMLDLEDHGVDPTNREALRLIALGALLTRAALAKEQSQVINNYHGVAAPEASPAITSPAPEAAPAPAEKKKGPAELFVERIVQKFGVYIEVYDSNGELVMGPETFNTPDTLFDDVRLGDMPSGMITRDAREALTFNLAVSSDKGNPLTIAETGIQDDETAQEPAILVSYEAKEPKREGEARVAAYMVVPMSDAQRLYNFVVPAQGRSLPSQRVIRGTNSAALSSILTQFKEDAKLPENQEGGENHEDFSRNITALRDAIDQYKTTMANILADEEDGHSNMSIRSNVEGIGPTGALITARIPIPPARNSK